MLHKISHVRGFTLRARDGDIGRSRDFYFDDQKWVIRYLVAETGKWLPLRKVLISPHSIKAIREEEKFIQVDLTKDQIEKSPSIDHDKPVSRQYETEFNAYYSYPYYWQGVGLWGPLPRPFSGLGELEYPAGGPVPTYIDPKTDTLQPAATEHIPDPHLRSAGEVTGYHIHVTDGEIGHIEDFILNDEFWAIDYLVIDTRNWWPGKKVLLPPCMVEAVDWERSRIDVPVDRATIKAAPEYDHSMPISRDYESRLFNYYERDPHWEMRQAA